MAKQPVISPSLLKSIDWNRKVPPDFDLGMDDWVDDDAFEPPRAKKRAVSKENSPPRPKKLQLRTKKGAGNKRFDGGFREMKADDYRAMAKPFVPKKHAKKRVGV